MVCWRRRKDILPSRCNLVCGEDKVSRLGVQKVVFGTEMGGRLEKRRRFVCLGCFLANDHITLESCHVREWFMNHA